ncbi:MAG TPA: metallopeptidase family protein [Candidatus Peribacteraceae bacterium]|nr:metallopeptidase family protein [Candidatus Peribacteraceae bacterium]
MGTDFESIAWEAIDALPDHIKAALQNVIIVIEDRSPPKFGRSLLLGLYEGVPLTVWGRDFSGKMPDKISLFREPIEVVAGTPENVPRVIRETVWHEVGHYFGLDHDQIGKMEQRWRAKH